MLITDGQVTLSVEPLLSNNGTAAYVGLSSNLVDGRPGTQAAVQWTSGSQTTSSYISLVFKLTPTPTIAFPARLFAIYFNRQNQATALKAGTKLELLGGPTNNPTNVMATTTIKRLPDGRLATWVYLPTQSNTWQYWAWRIYNDDGDTNYISASQIIYVGEVFADGVRNFPLSRFKVLPTDPTRLNRSSGNQPWPVMRYPFRRTSIQVVPQPFATAFVTPNENMQQLMFKLSTARYFAVVPRDRPRAGSTPDENYVQNMAQLVRAIDIGALESEASNDYWPIDITSEELL